MKGRNAIFFAAACLALCGALLSNATRRASAQQEEEVIGPADPPGPGSAHLRYLAINVGNVDLSNDDCEQPYPHWEAKLCDPEVVSEVRNYIYQWQPDIVMLSEVYFSGQLAGEEAGGPILPDGYDGICGLSRDRYTQRVVDPFADNASHEHECIAWNARRITPVPGGRASLRYNMAVRSFSEYGRNDAIGLEEGCNYDFTGFAVDLWVEGSFPVRAVAVHPQSGFLGANSVCRVEEIRRYWTSLADYGCRNVIIGGDWNTESMGEIDPPPNFRVNYSDDKHWNLTIHIYEWTAIYWHASFRYDHAFSSFGEPCLDCGRYYGTANLPYASALGDYDGHPRADGGSGLDHRQILIDMKLTPRGPCIFETPVEEPN